jgi:hypothetical protein
VTSKVRIRERGAKSTLKVGKAQRLEDKNSTAVLLPVEINTAFEYAALRHAVCHPRRYPRQSTVLRIQQRAPTCLLLPGMTLDCLLFCGRHTHLMTAQIKSNASASIAMKLPSGRYRYEVKFLFWISPEFDANLKVPCSAMPDGWCWSSGTTLNHLHLRPAAIGKSKTING